MTGEEKGAMEMQEILQYLKNHGERLDSEIAAATGLSLAHVRRGMSDLSAKGDVMMCRSIRFKDGKQIEGMSCRVSGYIPPAAPGRKAKAHKP
jgi:predicted ArsR family transcriptional regulator